MKIVFRVDASLSIGSGHVMRCLNLANALKKLGNECVFITKEHPGNYISQIQLLEFDTFIIENSTIYNRDYIRSESEWLGGSQQDDALMSIKLCEMNGFSPDIVIVDHYSIDASWEIIFKGKYPYIKMIVIDDLCSRQHQCDLLIDSTIDREQKDYENLTPSNCQFLLGTQYSLIKQDFELLRNKAIEKRTHEIITPKKILVTMGGVDMDNVTARVLSMLNEISDNDIEVITVILGTNCPHKDEILSLAQKSHLNIQVKININNMPEEMLEHDIAIGALGSTTWERATLGLPTINIAIAPNQFVIVDKLKKHGFIVLESSNFSERSFSYAWKNLRIHYSDFVDRSLKLCDGRGLHRVVNHIMELQSQPIIRVSI